MIIGIALSIISCGESKIKNEAIIEKALKNAEKPEFNVDVIWDNFPLKQIEMLKDIMEIPEDEIIDWYLDNIEMAEVVDALKTAIRSKILCNEGEELANQIKAITDTNVNTVNNCCDPGFYVDMSNNNKISNLDSNAVHVTGDITLATSAKKTTKKSTTKTTKKKN